jgi:serine protease inhibitor
MRKYNGNQNMNENMNGTINNRKLFDRNFQNINNRKNNNSHIDRLFLEREFETKNNYSDEETEKVGEITGGDMMEDNTIDKGMPMRSQYNPKKPVYDSNKYLDFNLFDKKPSKLKVGYSDDNNNYSSYADINNSMTSITQQVNPEYIVSNSIEDIGTRLFKCMFNSLPNNNFIICTFGLYSLFSSLYLLSNGNTENETKKFFNLPDKNTLGKSLYKLNSIIDSSKSENMMNIKNFFVMGNNIPCNLDSLRMIEQFCTIAQVNITEPEREAIKMTYLIDRLMGKKMRNPVTSSNIENLQIMLMTTVVIHPKWNNTFDRMGKGIFYGYDEERKQNYLISNGKVFPYFEDNEHQILEIYFDGSGGDNSKYAFGIVLHKTNQIAETNEKLHFYIEHMKPTTLDEVRIPAFTQDLKFRFNNLIKKMGYKTPFYQIHAKNIFPEGNVQLQDIIQNVKITIDNSVREGFNHPTRGCHTIQKFIVDKPFFYYFRSLQTKTIFINGLFQ